MNDNVSPSPAGCVNIKLLANKKFMIYQCSDKTVLIVVWRPHNIIVCLTGKKIWASYC